MRRLKSDAWELNKYSAAGCAYHSVLDGIRLLDQSPQRGSLELDHEILASAKSNNIAKQWYWPLNAELRCILRVEPMIELFCKKQQTSQSSGIATERRAELYPAC